ncbi:hypothetical protein ACVWWI_006359 [Bradyrhizobium sp. USDA 3686]
MSRASLPTSKVRILKTFRFTNATGSRLLERYSTVAHRHLRRCCERRGERNSETLRMLRLSQRPWRRTEAHCLIRIVTGQLLAGDWVAAIELVRWRLWRERSAWARGGRWCRPKGIVAGRPPGRKRGASRCDMRDDRLASQVCGACNSGTRNSWTEAGRGTARAQARIWGYDQGRDDRSVGASDRVCGKRLKGRVSSTPAATPIMRLAPFVSRSTAVAHRGSLPQSSAAADRSRSVRRSCSRS